MSHRWNYTIVAFVLITASVILLPSCHKDEPQVPVIEIYSFSPSSGIIGRSVTIVGNNFIPEVPPEEGFGPHVNTSIVKFNGIITDAERVYQDSINKQRINTVVPEGATTGPITVTAMGHTATSTADFMVTFPDYLPNVTVSTASSYGGIDVDIDAEGNLYVANNDQLKIVKIMPNGSMMTLWSSDAFIQEIPIGIAVDKHGNVFATIDNSIRKITPDGTVTILAGSSTSGFADGSGMDAQFSLPFGIALDTSGNIYTADIFNHRIRKITADGLVTTIAGSTPGFADGQGSQAQFLSPIDLTVDNEGNIYVSDDRKVRKITPDGFVSTIAAGTTRGYLDGPANTAQFSGLRGIAVDSSGNIYLCDSGNFVVRKISLDGMVTTVAGSNSGYLDGPGNLALFGQTRGLTIGSDGALYLTQGGGLFNVRKIVID